MISRSTIFRTAALCASVALSVASLGCGGSTAEAGGGATETGANQGGLVGQKAPEIAAAAVTGEGPKTLAEASGKVVILDFWATYCAPCKKSFPKYQEMVEELGSDVAVIAVSVDDPEDATEDKLKKFAEETGVKFSIVWDKDKATAGKYSPPKMPTSFIIDKDGNVKHVHAGYESGEEAKIADEVKALLGK
ncbi:TlpA family protein disulfide reductase [Chondromyces apiculatus]|uniref:Thiol:disulfide oxidoreductase n=1 Tax=Chondromyces apiculatus DSM 436 TaxID=1192034 RepID=A0A017T524_9BACT|nr:TlpA disulfide reductase family protein [Chondromyces apiculatus]EYF04339.1 Thiol:disulfide oxidoreductase [Chondromyces apiculatus DSM 436]